MGQQKKYDRQIAAPVSEEMRQEVAQAAQGVRMTTAEFIRASLCRAMLEIKDEGREAFLRLAGAETAWDLRHFPVEYATTDGDRSLTLLRGDDSNSRT